jgi:hypothetical protein
MLISGTSKKIPARAKRAGDVFFATDSQHTFFGLHGGEWLDLTALLSADPPLKFVAGPQGVQGPPGKDGASVQGPAGRDGKDGADSTVPGPRGPRGIGERGPKGDKASAPVIEIGSVDTLPHGEKPKAVIRQAGENSFYLDLFLPAGAPGKDGASIVGRQGPRGDITSYGNEELRQAVQKMKAQMIERHARTLAAIERAMQAAGTLSPARKKHFELMLSSLRKEAGL